MIRVLRNWNEIGSAVNSLKADLLPLHLTPEKNWDLHLLKQVLDAMPPGAPVYDLGCGDLYGARFIAALGRDVVGVDLSISTRARLVQFRRWQRSKFRRFPIRLRRGDITKLNVPDQSIVAAASISVIEHGVDPEKFLAEASRVLSPGGILFITTDYWPTGVPEANGVRAYGLPWQPFDEAGIRNLVRQAQSKGLQLLQETDFDLSSEDRCVNWNGATYTFIALGFRRS
jgi:SAM-dependent methyltransferase